MSRRGSSHRGRAGCSRILCDQMRLQLRRKYRGRVCLENWTRGRPSPDEQKVDLLVAVEFDEPDVGAWVCGSDAVRCQGDRPAPDHRMQTFLDRVHEGSPTGMVHFPKMAPPVVGRGGKAHRQCSYQVCAIQSLAHREWRGCRYSRNQRLGSKYAPEESRQAERAKGEGSVNGAAHDASTPVVLRTYRARI
jgi:hypothetical protein